MDGTSSFSRFPPKENARDAGAALELRFPATRDTVQGILAMAQEWAVARGIARADLGTLRLALEELLLNICFHAYPDSGPEAAGASRSANEAELLLRLDAPPAGAGSSAGRVPAQEEKLLFLRVRDAGRPFDPLAYQPAPVAAEAGAMTAGGRGISFMRLLAVEASYSRENGLNVLSLTLPLSAAQAADGPDAETGTPAAPGSPRHFLRRPGLLPDMRRVSLAVKQTVFLGLCTALIVWSAIFFFHRAVNAGREEAAQALGGQIMRTLDRVASDFFHRLTTGAETLAASLGESYSGGEAAGSEGPPLKTRDATELARALLAEKAVLGLVYTDDSRFQEWLLTLRDDTLTQTPLASTFAPAWAANRRNRGGAVWQGPVADIPKGLPGNDAALFLGAPWRGGGTNGAATAGGGENRSGGMIGALVSTPEMARLLRAAAGIAASEPFMLNRNGEYMLVPPSREQGDRPGSIFDEARVSGSVFLEELGRAMLWGEEGITHLSAGDAEKAVPWALPEHGPASVLYRPVQAAGPPHGLYLGLLLPSRSLGGGPVPLPPGLALFALAGSAAFCLLVWRVTSQTLLPLRDLSAGLEKMAAGDLASPLPAPLRPDETGSMLHSFERVRLTLRAALRNLITRTATQERLANELAVARAIQEGMLTTEFPSSPLADVCARIDMAREVCGDLYDCFLMTGGGHGGAPEERLCCVVGDVSGKGVPAAMLMSGAVSLARAALLEGLPPAAVLGRVNNSLVRTATAGMFVTMIVGVLEPRSGRFIWASAGHPPPMLVGPPRSGRENWPPTCPWPGELVLGARRDVRYSTFSRVIEPGGAALLYTDGAVEACPAPYRGQHGGHAAGSFFGEERLARSLSRHRDKADARGQLEGIRADLFAHMAGADPHDDITLMVIRRRCGAHCP